MKLKLLKATELDLDLSEDSEVYVERSDGAIVRISCEVVEQASTEIQTLILSKTKFSTLRAASKWVKDHSFKVRHKGKAPDETADSWRFRQKDPGDFQAGSFRTITITDGVKAVVGKPKTSKADDEEVVETAEEETYSVEFLPIDKADEDRQIAFGIVLEPDEIDAHGDTIKAHEIARAAHLWLARFQDRGLQHSEIVNSKIEIYESFIAPIKMKIGGQVVKKGTWLLMVHVLDKTIWKKIKSGGLTGFSMGGFARKVKL